MFNFSTQDLISILYSIPCVLISLVFHEVAHGWVACKLGDPTARNLGRLSLNPLKHMDPIGTLCMIFFHFGWAKPVPVNMRYFKKPRRDMALVAAAGPATNFILALIGGFAYIILRNFVVMKDPNVLMYYWGLNYGVTDVAFSPTFVTYIKIAAYEFSSVFHFLNLSLMLFNLIPINPLDGSRILHLLLPPKAYYWLMNHERIIMIVMMVLLWTGIITKPLSAAVDWISDGMLNLISSLPFLG